MAKYNAKNKNIVALASGLVQFGQIGFYIVLPILLAVLVGRYLDNHFFLKHYFFTLIFPFFGGIFSLWFAYKIATGEIKK